MAQAQAPGVTVINVPPEFSAIEIGIQGGFQRVYVIVSDYNSWGDILRVDLEILDDGRGQIAHVVFQQYANNQTLIREPLFLENLGRILVHDQSLASVNTDPQTIADRSELRVTFTLVPLVGRWLRVTATDLDGLVATAQVEYLTGTLGGAPTIHPLVLLLSALVASVVLVRTRLRRELRGR